jgi:hypothetical protein
MDNIQGCISVARGQDARSDLALCRGAHGCARAATYFHNNAGHRPVLISKHKKPPPSDGGFRVRSLAVTYFRMEKPHTIIGAKRFHFRVRNGIGWFPLAIAARQKRKSGKLMIALHLNITTQTA